MGADLMANLPADYKYVMLVNPNKHAAIYQLYKANEDWVLAQLVGADRSDAVAKAIMVVRTPVFDLPSTHTFSAEVPTKRMRVLMNCSERRAHG